MGQYMHLVLFTVGFSLQRDYWGTDVSRQKGKTYTVLISLPALRRQDVVPWFGNLGCFQRITLIHSDLSSYNSLLETSNKKGWIRHFPKKIDHLIHGDKRGGDQFTISDKNNGSSCKVLAMEIRFQGFKPLRLQHLHCFS